MGVKYEKQGQSEKMKNSDKQFASCYSGATYCKSDQAAYGEYLFIVGFRAFSIGDL